MRRAVFDEDHELFRQTLRAFIEAEVVPHYDQWFAAGLVPRDFYYKLAGLGLFGTQVPEEYGGNGVASFKFTAVQHEETARAAAGERLEGLVAGLRRAGLAASGRLGPDAPVQALGDALAVFPAAEVLIVTAEDAGWLERGLFERARAFAPVVEHVEVRTPAGV